MQSTPEYCRVVRGGFIAVIAEAAAGTADQRRQSGAAADTAGIECGTTARSNRHRRRPTDQQVPAGYGPSSRCFPGIEDQRGGSRVCGGDILCNGEVAAQCFDANRSRCADPAGHTDRTDSQGIAIYVGQCTQAAGRECADGIGSVIECHITAQQRQSGGTE